MCLFENTLSKKPTKSQNITCGVIVICNTKGKVLVTAGGAGSIVSVYVGCVLCQLLLSKDQLPVDSAFRIFSFDSDFSPFLLSNVILLLFLGELCSPIE